MQRSAVIYDTTGHACQEKDPWSVIKIVDDAVCRLHYDCGRPIVLI